MSDFNPRPWEVSLEQYKELEASLKPDNELIKLSIKLTKRLGERRYGHVAAYLYREWAHAQGKDATIAWWKQYDAWVAGCEEPQPAKIAEMMRGDLFG